MNKSSAKDGRKYNLDRDEIMQLVIEVSEEVYERSEIDCKKHMELEEIITNLRYETEQIIAEVVETALKTVC